MRNNKGHTVLIILGSVVGIFVVAFGWYYRGYNRAVNIDEMVVASWAQIENQLQRRHDTVGVIVTSVRGAARDRTDFYIEVTELRDQWETAVSISEKIHVAHALTERISRLRDIAQGYPKLTNAEHYKNLINQLERAQGRIEVEGRRYNDSVDKLSRFRKTLSGKFFDERVGTQQDFQKY